MDIRFWASFLRFLFYFFQKLQFLVTKWQNFEIVFPVLHFYLYELKKFQILKLLYQTWDINTFVPRRDIFSGNVELRNSFSDEKKILAVKSETYFSREGIKFECGKVLMEYSIIRRNWSCANLFIMQNYTDNVNGDVSLTVDNAWYFQFPLRSRCANIILERKTKLLYKLRWHYMVKVYNRSTWRRYEICSMSRRKTAEQNHWRHCRSLLVNFKHGLHLSLLFWLLNLTM